MEYEQLTGASVGQFVDRFISGENLYINNDDDFYVIIGHPSISDIDGWLNSGLIYTRKESPWWEGCEGSVIMVHGKREEFWYPIILDRVDEDSNYPYKSNDNEYMFGRPLTTAERDAIKVRD